MKTRAHNGVYPWLHGLHINTHCHNIIVLYCFTDISLLLVFLLSSSQSFVFFNHFNTPWVVSGEKSMATVHTGHWFHLHLFIPTPQRTTFYYLHHSTVEHCGCYWPCQIVSDLLINSLVDYVRLQVAQLAQVAHHNAINSRGRPTAQLWLHSMSASHITLQLSWWTCHQSTTQLDQ